MLRRQGFGWIRSWFRPATSHDFWQETSQNLSQACLSSQIRIPVWRKRPEPVSLPAEEREELPQEHAPGETRHLTECCAWGIRPKTLQSIVRQRGRPGPAPARLICPRCDVRLRGLQSIFRQRGGSAVTPAGLTRPCRDVRLRGLRSIFGSEEALQQHLRDSPTHQHNPETPLDIFFRSFPTFDYDRSLPPATSHARLQRHEGWRRGDEVSADAWDRYQTALEGELRKWYGAENDITAWHVSSGLRKHASNAKQYEAPAEEKSHAETEHRLYAKHSSTLLI